MLLFNTSRPQCDRHLADDIFKCMSLKGFGSYFQRFVPNGLLNNNLLYASLGLSNYLASNRRQNNTWINQCWPSSTTHIQDTRIFIFLRDFRYFASGKIPVIRLKNPTLTDKDNSFHVVCTIWDSTCMYLLFLISWLVYTSPGLNALSHWGRVTHICVSKLTIIGSDNGLSPGRRQAIIWTNVGILLIGL